MQRLERLSNVQKAKLLHELFPGEIPSLIEYTENLCVSILEQQEQVIAGWNNGFMSADYWLQLVATVRERIAARLHYVTGSSKVFSEQLFSDLNAVVMSHCLYLYALKDRKHPNRKFMLVIDLLFQP